MPSPVQEAFADMQFPLKGVDVSKGFGAQQPGTTPVGRNVRGYEPASKRAKGGGRPGLAKYLAAQLPSGAHLIQNLNIVDPADDSALLSNVFDWPGLPFGGVGDPSVPSVPLPPPAPVSIPAFPAFPGSPGFPAVPAFPGIAWTLDVTTPGLGTGHTATVQIQNPQPGQPSSVTVAVPSDWGSTTVGEGIDSRNPGRIIPVGGSGAALTKNKAKKLLPTIVWANPAPRPVGTVLTGTQLNAVARDPNTSAVVPGTFLYAPPAGVATTTSPQSLYVLFTPMDLTKYTVNTKAVSISSPAAAAFVREYDCAATGTPAFSTPWAPVDAVGSPVTPTPAANALLLVAVAIYHTVDPGAPTAVTDDAGNTYTKAASVALPATIFSGAGVANLSLWYCVAAAVTITTITTVTPTDLSTVSLAVVSWLEFAGKTTADGSGQSSSGVGTAVTTGSIATAAAGDICVGLFLPSDDNNIPTITAAGGSTAVPPGFNTVPALAYLLNSGFPSQAVAGTFSVAGYLALGVAFK